MNAPPQSDDPFAAMMTRRVKPIEVEGWPTFELREAPMSEVEPLIFNDGSIPPQEVLFRLIGASIWIGEHRGSADMLKRMGPTAIQKLIEAVHGDIFELYGIGTEATVATTEPAVGNGAAAPAPKEPKAKKKG